MPPQLGNFYSDCQFDSDFKILTATVVLYKEFLEGTVHKFRNYMHLFSCQGINKKIDIGLM